jgi:hypothetical protein
MPFQSKNRKEDKFFLGAHFKARTGQNHSSNPKLIYPFGGGKTDEDNEGVISVTMKRILNLVV